MQLTAVYNTWWPRLCRRLQTSARAVKQSRVGCTASGEAGHSQKQLILNAVSPLWVESGRFMVLPARFRGNAPPSLRMLQQHLHAQPIVTRLTAPAGRCSSCIYPYASLVIPVGQPSPVGEGRHMIACNAVEALPVRLNESECAVVENEDLHGTFMHFAVMKAAQ